MQTVVEFIFDCGKRRGERLEWRVKSKREA
jgi:hypothetical protein